MKAEDILALLQADEELRQFILAFYNRLADDNPKREVGARSPQEYAMDALGRLLVGDEVCAAVAADSTRLYVASNSADHSQAQARLMIDSLDYGFNHDATRVQIMANARVFSLRDDGTPTPEIPKKFPMGEYAYDSAHHRLTPIDTNPVRLEIPYAEHAIDAYPFPIGWTFTKPAELQLTPENKVYPNIQVTELMKGTPGSAPHVVRLDPLFRRSAIVFSHLGLISLAVEKSEFASLRFQAASAGNRKRVMVQTFGWEIPKWYKLNKTIRRYDDKDLPKQQKLEHRAKQETLRSLHTLIVAVTEDFNEYLSAHPAPSSISSLVKKWKITLLQKIYAGTFKIPTFVEQESTNEFLDALSLYLQELIFLENHIRDLSLCGGNLFTYSLAEIGKRETLARDADAALEIIDAHLLEGAHAEVRLFYLLMVQGGRTTGKMPYFGITQLCCACCHTLFKSHGMNFTEGSMHRAGTQATYFGNWIIDPKMRTETVLKPFLGKIAFVLYQRLSLDQQNLACNIIQDLAILWFKANDARLAQLEALGFKKGAIAREGSPYPNIGHLTKPSSKVNGASASAGSDLVGGDLPSKPNPPPKVSLSIFRKILTENLGETPSWVNPDGDCQFRAIVRALEPLDPVRYAALQENQAGQNFVFFRENPEQQRVNFLRRTAVKYITDHPAEYEPFLANDAGPDGFEAGQDLVFANLEDYAEQMREPGVYGDNLTLRAIAEYLGRPIIVLQPGITADPVDVRVVTVPEGAPIDINQAIVLVFNGVDHYEVILHRPQDILPEAFCERVAEKYNGVTAYSMVPTHK